MPSRSWIIPAEKIAVPTLRRSVVDFARAQHLDEAAIADLALAVSEAVTNSVIHGYRDGPAGMVSVMIDIEPGRDTFTVRVVDRGGGARPRSDSPGIGLGLPLLAEVTEELAVRAPPTGHGTEVLMRFRLPATG
jgi:serine/threonine-protein kinase RsbW